jgi:tetratricopeptide (TPR) repeat protein
MKAISLFSLLVTIMPLAAQDAAKSSDPALAAGKESLLPNQKAFLNLPEESRKTFVKYFSEASRLAQQKRIFEAMEEIEKAIAIFPDSPEVYNLRGSCFVEIRAFDKALADFKKAAEYSTSNVGVNFNIAEVYFVTKEWQKSVDIFERILKDIPESNTAMSRLVEFKILLCKKKLGLNDEATILAEKYDFLDDSPYYYYAQAAIAYEDKNLMKAEEWLAIASRIFKDPNILAPWQDTMVEYGYIKSFYGEDPVEP